MIKSILLGFKYAFSGLFLVCKTERNFRIHLTAALSVGLFSIIYGISGVQLALILAVFALVLFAEIINTAVEILVNMQVQGFNLQAKTAKDVSAAAVLVTAIFAVIIAVITFSDAQKLAAVYGFLTANIFRIIILIIYIIFAVIFVRGVKKEWKIKK